MRLVTPSGRSLWLTYCMNVHPGGRVETTEDAIRSAVLPLRERLGVEGPFALGLRFDAKGALSLSRDTALADRLTRLFQAHDLAPLTANAFVLGAFHGAPLKEEVYAPTWASEERLQYTVAMAEVLARWARELGHAHVSLSTAPGSWRAWGVGPDVERPCAAGLARAARHLRALAEETGVRVSLGLEPEPRCTLETTEEAIAFFEGPLRRELEGEAEALGHLGVCFDVCHQAVVHEDLPRSLDRLRVAGVPVVKMQASSALEVRAPVDAAALAALAAFDEPVYLHQVGARDGAGRLHVTTDLEPVLLDPDAWRPRAPWRVHFHVPVFRSVAAFGLHTTQPELDRALASVASGDVTDHLEIETYTWDVLPDAERRAGAGFDLVDALEREYLYVLGVLEHHGVRRATSPELEA